jgi:hypothetical protein
MGDFNFDFFNQNDFKNFNDIIDNFNLKQLVKEKTYITSNYANKLHDILLTDNPNLFNCIEVIDNIDVKCDHLAVYSEIKVCKLKEITKYTIKYELNETNINRVNAELMILIGNPFVNQMKSMKFMI